MVRQSHDKASLFANVVVTEVLLYFLSKQNNFFKCLCFIVLIYRRTFDNIKLFARPREVRPGYNKQNLIKQIRNVHRRNPTAVASPMNIIFKYIGLFALLQKERYIFVFNLTVVSLGLPLPLRRPP